MGTTLSTRRDEFAKSAAADLDPDARRARRETESTALLAKIAAEGDQLAHTVLPKSPLGNAVSCALAGVSPFEYLKDVLLRVATHPQRLIGQLTPTGWSATFCRQAAA